MFCTPGRVFGGTEGVGSRLHVLRSRTRFRWYRGRLVLFSCFPLPNSFSTITKGDGSHFYVLGSRTRFRRYRRGGSRFLFLRARTHFRRYRRRWVPFSFFTLPDSFSAAPRVSGPVFLFCALRLVFGCSGGFRSRFNVLYPRTRFRRCRGRRVPSSCFALRDLFLAVPERKT
jgi:hypothetical protein